MGGAWRDPVRVVVPEPWVGPREHPALSPLAPGSVPFAGALGPGKILLQTSWPSFLIPALDRDGCLWGLPRHRAGWESLGWPRAPELPSLCLGLQYPLAFALSFSRWLCAHPELYRLPVTLNSASPVAPGDLITKGSLVSVAGWLREWEWVWARGWRALDA